MDATALKLGKIWQAASPLAAGEPGNLILWVRTGKYVRRSFDDGTWPATRIVVVCEKRLLAKSNPPRLRGRLGNRQQPRHPRMTPGTVRRVVAKAGHASCFPTAT